MTRYDQKILFTSLAFATVLIRDTNLGQSDNEARVLRLAGLFEDFCVKHISLPVEIKTIPDGDKIDRTIEKHVNELRNLEATILPQDKDGLLQLYHRLQYRKICRNDIDPLKKLNANELADFVLAQLDEEITYMKEHQ